MRSKKRLLSQFRQVRRVFEILVGWSGQHLVGGDLCRRLGNPFRVLPSLGQNPKGRFGAAT